MQSTQCQTCARNLVIGPPGGICRAFPLGKPQEILNGRFDHSKAHPEQFNKDILRIEAGEGPDNLERFPQEQDFEGIPIRPGDEAPEFPPFEPLI